MVEKFTLNRRDFLWASCLIASGQLLKLRETPQSAEKPLPQSPIQEILTNSPEISPAIGGRDFSFVPKSVEGQFSGLHSIREPVITAVPYEKGGEEIYGYGGGVVEAIQNGQNVLLTLIVPEPPKKKDPKYKENYALWQKEMAEFEERITTRARFFVDSKHKATFAIGNEINDPYSFFGKNYTEYVDLYLKARKIIKKISPNSRVAPWQQAFWGDGALLEQFLKAIKAKGETIDYLFVNFYGLWNEMEEWIRIHRRLLSSQGLNVPIAITELSIPTKHSSLASGKQKASAVVQLLATAAYLQKNASLNMEVSAWFSAFTPACHPQDFALSTSREGKFVIYPGLFALIACCHLLAGEKITYERSLNGLVKVASNDGCFVWNDGKETQTVTPTLGQTVWTPTGEKLPFSRQVKLNPSTQPKICSGDTVILTNPR